MKKTSILLGATALFLATGAVSAAPGGMTTRQDVLVDGNGMTLYTFDNDGAGVSNCYDSCAGNWPPYIAATSDKNQGDFKIVKRADGARQWTYNGAPLYFWIADSNPGDKSGDGVGGVWHVVSQTGTNSNSNSGSSY